MVLAAFQYGRYRFRGRMLYGYCLQSRLLTTVSRNFQPKPLAKTNYLPGSTQKIQKLVIRVRTYYTFRSRSHSLYVETSIRING